MTLDLRETADGVLIPVQVVPRASRTGIDGEVEGALRVRLAAPPVEGAANRELLEFLAKRLRLPKRDLMLESGERSKRKSVRVRGLSRQEILERLQERV
ncbi:DUF167 domain-containing protein [Nitrolancea hollandica]|uniref:UPF0235 protein NITHO_760002 n=1 Tax=Nitrolancea hollandica Lb TaxID=1129897 RepID=I4EN60_9BACT|nr:DUF167 domain-containing protein [Nitrolancea hollandica]CCF86123.1 conserved hypothetical protein [Nitrolancea hollandica Lb]